MPFGNKFDANVGVQFAFAQYSGIRSASSSTSLLANGDKSVYLRHTVGVETKEDHGKVLGITKLTSVHCFLNS